jgi:hypothetical protein
VQKEIEGKEFDLCYLCWHPLEEKLAGRGRVKGILEELEQEEHEETSIY